MLWVRIQMIGSALSQLLNVFFTLDLTKTGPNESVSARMHRQGRRREKLVNLLFFLQPDHCEKAHLSDVADARALLAEIERKNGDA